eukprot:3541328-Alexandrium_andersonii.AAC.1
MGFCRGLRRAASAKAFRPSRSSGPCAPSLLRALAWGAFARPGLSVEQHQRSSAEDSRKNWKLLPA